MGYFQKGEGQFMIRRENMIKAYEAMCALNDQDDLKNGGSWGGEINSKSPRPEGMDHHPARWFSWMPADYPNQYKTVEEILEALGFEVDLRDNGLFNVVNLFYDNKMGQENLFFQVMIPFLEELWVRWEGEDGSTWVWARHDDKLLLIETNDLRPIVR